MKLVNKFKKGLEKTRGSFGQKLGYLFRSRSSEGQFYDDLEEILVTSDVGVDTSMRLVEDFKQFCTENSLFGTEKMKDSFYNFLLPLFSEGRFDFPDNTLTIIMLIGVNGSGKTTTAGKLASIYKKMGKKVMLAAADTFRAAAIEQLSTWAERVDVPIIKQKQGADPGAVVFDAISSAKAKGYDILIADTAGRFHNKENLVRELQKIDRIVGNKTDAGDRYYKLGVLDATAGSNAFVQADSFNKAINLDGVVVTKLDSSARGGVALSISSGIGLPIYYVGMGEKTEDMVPFEADSFVSSLFSD